jgi:hypothetical protein
MIWSCSWSTSSWVFNAKIHASLTIYQHLVLLGRFEVRVDK